jgi:HPt (histidine-containing phosphotransfer) domain-containing protein
MTDAENLPPHVVVSRFLEPIFPLFLEIQENHLIELRFALAAGNAAEVVRLAHSIKGATATYQLPDAADLAARLEITAKNSPLYDAQHLFEELARYLQNVRILFLGE